MLHIWRCGPIRLHFSGIVNETEISNRQINKWENMRGLRPQRILPAGLSRPDGLLATGSRLSSLLAPSETEKETSWSRGRAGPVGAPRLEPSVLWASFAINLLSLGLPIVILQVYDRILPNQAYETLAVLILSLCVVLLLDGFFRSARSYLTGWTAARFEHMTACRMVDRLLGSPLAAFESNPPGVHLDRLQSVDQLREFYAGQARLIMIDLPFVVLFLGLIWFIAGLLVLIPVVLLALLGVATWAIGRELKETLAQRRDLDDRRYSFIIEILNGIHTVKLLAMEALMQRRYERLQENGAATTYRTIVLSNLAQNLGGLLTNVIMATVAAVGATYVVAGNLTIGGLAACTLLSGRAVQPMLRALSLWTQIQSITLAKDRAQELFTLEPETAEDAAPAAEISGAFSLEDLRFAYEPGGTVQLDGIDLSVGAGEVIGITGDTGCGKTTLLMLIRSMFRPTSGRVLFDGVDATTMDPQSLRDQIGYLPQNAVLFQGTILENLAMFRGRRATESAMEASQQLQIHEAINRLPAGFETPVGTGSQDDLPAGLRQGIAMARALATKPKLLLFDDANSAFDSRSDARLKAVLQEIKGNATIVLVSHRPSLLSLADRIFLLQDGKLSRWQRPPMTPTKTVQPATLSGPNRPEQSPAKAGSEAQPGTETGRQAS